MKTLTCVLIGLSVLGASATTQAAPTEDPCPPTVKPPTKPRKPRAKTPKVVVTPPTVKPCDCPPGAPGKPGRDGRDGRDGSNGMNTHTHTAGEGGLSLRPGLMGAVMGPHADWAWGPALQLAQPVGKNGEFVVDAGIAAIADGVVGDERGLLLHAGYTRYMSKQLGLTVGVHSTMIDGNIDGNYLGVDFGVVIRAGRVRVELTPVLGGLRDDNESGTQFAVGLAGSMFVSL